ncbi:MAG: SHOCT domain-containing protein [Clostridia bacterium]|nr:SHOCT domain-containing protein [Clostridia bacterium]
MWSSIGQIAGGLGGAYTASAVNQTNAQNSLNKIVDFNRCPQCNSTNLAIISDEEFEAIKTQTVATSQPAVSIADELKKFKELLDMGAITQEEFDAKKKELLGL